MRVTECCCGCSLRTGTLIIGYFHAIGGFMATVAFSTMTYISANGMPPNFQKDELLMLIFGICSVVSLIQHLVSVSLIYGCYTGKKGFLFPWKIFAWISFVLAVGAVALSLIRLIITADVTMLVGAAVQGIQAVLLLYFIVVVTSYEESLVQQTGVVYVAHDDPRRYVNFVNNV